MALPPGFLDELRNRVSISQVAGRKVMWDTRKSNQAKGDWWAPCPFHQEKTASFHVDDRKGFYYCFGCQAKGDALGFIKETENVSFMEAVEILAREAGMQMPARDPRAQEKLDRNAQLAKATEAAVAYFRLQLKTGAAAAARDYLAGRGLDEEALDRFQIGFAPGGRQGAFAALKDKGVPEADLIEAGIATKPDDGGTPYDAFRDRIMFPIRDPRGRCIGFGGRAMDPNARAKYLNSRETPLFDKGRALYNHAPAREAAGKGAPLLVAEGYMDVIALSRAGFGAAVAPLGTAITEDQLRLIWRMTDEPVVMLDGDAAGQRAATRLVGLALPLLEAGKTLRFALLPEGQDPDDLLRAQGPQAVQALIDGAVPLVEMLWRRETEGQSFDTPERRAALDQNLRRVLGTIPDPGLRRHYGDAIAERRRALFRPQRAPWPAQRGPRGAWRPSLSGFAEAQAPLSETRQSALGAGSLSGDALRIALIVATLCRYPGLVARFEPDLDRLNPQDPDPATLIDRLLATEAKDGAQFSDELSENGAGEALERVRSTGHLRISPLLHGPDDPAKAAACLTEEFAKIAADRALADEMAEAIEDLDAPDGANHALAQRINHAVQARHRAAHPPAAEGGIGTDDMADLSKNLQALIDAKVWEKKNH